MTALDKAMEVIRGLDEAERNRVEMLRLRHRLHERNPGMFPGLDEAETTELMASERERRRTMAASGTIGSWKP